MKTSRDVFTAVISDVKSDLCYTDDNERLMISLDSDLTFNEETPMVDVTGNVKRLVDFFYLIWVEYMTVICSYMR